MQTDSSTVFAGLLADVVYADDLSAGDGEAGGLALTRFEAWFRHVAREDFYLECAQLDEAVLRRLPKAIMLKIAKLIEGRFPDAVSRMPTLRAARDHLERASQLAKVFAPESLKVLVDALAEDDEVAP